MSDNVEKFFSEQATRQLNPEERITALKLMEMQRHAMLMYTSCGWFFDELSGIETTQVIQYAARTIQLYEELFGEPLEPMFLDRLEIAKSNISEHKDGRVIYEKFVRPAMVDRQKVAAHYALMSFGGIGAWVVVALAFSVLTATTLAWNPIRVLIGHRAPKPESIPLADPLTPPKRRRKKEKEEEALVAAGSVGLEPAPEELPGLVGGGESLHLEESGAEAFGEGKRRRKRSRADMAAVGAKIKARLSG